MRNVPIGDGSNGRYLDGRDRHGLAVERHELDLEAFAVGVDVNNRLCAISLPLPRAGGLPVGLMLVARNGQDRKLFRMAAAVERMFAA